MTPRVPRRAIDPAARPAYLPAPSGCSKRSAWERTGSLLKHLRDGSVIQVESVLDRVASAVQRPVQANAAIRVTSDLFAPAMSFIHNRAKFLDGKCRL